MNGLLSFKYGKYLPSLFLSAMVWYHLCFPALGVGSPSFLYFGNVFVMSSSSLSLETTLFYLFSFKIDFDNGAGI